MVVAGEVLSRGRRGRQALPARRRAVLRRAGPDLRAAPLEHGARRGRLRPGRDAAPRDAQADRLGGVGAQAHRRDLPQARRARLPRADAARGGARRARGRARVEVRRYGGGEVLFKEGDAPDGLYLIRRGSVTVSRTIAGREVVLSYVSAGNYVGEMALLTDSPRSATVRAAVDHRGGRPRRRARSSGCWAATPRWREEMESRFLDRLRVNAAMEAAARPGQHHLLPAAAGRRRGHRRPADRRVAVRPLRQLREGLRRHPRRHLAARPRGRPHLRRRSTCRPRAGTASIRIA